MVTVSTETIALTSEPDVVAVRRRVREISAKLGFSLVDQTKVVTAASELARNTLIHGGGGTMHLETLNGPRVGLKLIFEDNGPGIPNIELALRDGYTTGTGLGLSICKGIIEAHSGRIWAENLTDGLAFNFTLPLLWAGARPPQLPVDSETE